VLVDVRIVCVKGWGLVIFHWFIVSMRMQIILDAPFRPPGFSPYMGREEKKSSRTGLIHSNLMLYQSILHGLLSSANGQDESNPAL